MLLRAFYHLCIGGDGLIVTFSISSTHIPSAHPPWWLFQLPISATTYGSSLVYICVGYCHILPKTFKKSQRIASQVPLTLISNWYEHRVICSSSDAINLKHSVISNPWSISGCHIERITQMEVCEMTSLGSYHGEQSSAWNGNREVSCEKCR